MPITDRAATAEAENGVYVVVWEFEVKAGWEAEFVAVYGADGDWARLFRREKGFLRVELARSVMAQNRFFTFDYWVSAAAFLEFCSKHGAAYEALDEKWAGITERERRIGAFPPE
ncbi:MAG TPA: antibiotic biosynthesis monooxygenase family protein [Acidisarcina sp.]|nr:antibiotic biosynthesis monooxygenase family protein [Acidisarcina sp.]